MISVDQAFAGLGDPTVIFIDATGVTTWAGQRLVATAGSSDARLVIYVLLLAAGLSAILTPNGAVAALLPMTVLVAMRLGRAVEAVDADGVLSPRGRAARPHRLAGVLRTDEAYRAVSWTAVVLLDISARPVLMSVAVGCSAAFLSPISTPGNLMIMGPAGYRFGDYWRFGLPLLGLFFRRGGAVGSGGVAAVLRSM